MSQSDATQNLHDKMIIMQATNYKKQGYTDIKVNHSNISQGKPAQIAGYTPDLSAVYNSKTTICEIVTNDSLDDTHTILKWRAFDKSGNKFHLIIPSNSINQVKEIARTNGISVDKYWYCKNY